MKNESYFIPSTTTIPDIQTYKTQWEAPSNIALVKYWGKKSNQIPANASVSFTLKNCKTITEVAFSKKENNQHFSFDFYFENQPKESFKPKLNDFLTRIEPYCPYLKAYHLKISSENTFPHSSGIASSASGMAALAFNIVSFERVLYPEITEEYFYEKASFLARLGSGSACRSIKGKVVVWGEHTSVPQSSHLFGVEVSEIHPVFTTFQDTILLVDVGEKQVSSTVGHNLMNNHPFANQRFIQAEENLTTLLEYLKNGNINGFINLVESEALTLHSMMMTSNPYFILMKPNTVAIIQKLWNFRTQTQIPVCFTLDAGANVHVLYPENEKDNVQHFIQTELATHCHNHQFINDCIGNGGINIF